MTRVRISPSLLDYGEAMAELVNEVCEENILIGMDRETIEDFGSPRTDGPELGVSGLLRPPRIEFLWPDIRLKDGHLDGLIQISTSEYFGVMNVYVILEDGQAHHIESAYAMDNDIVENHWGYVPSAPLPSGTTVIVHAIAMDRLGGIGTRTERRTV